MVYELLKRVIQQQNSYMTKDMILLQIEFFYTAGKLTDEQYTELKAMLIPDEQEGADGESGEPEMP